MKLSKLLLTTSLCAAVSGPALAQGKPFSDVDADASGSLSFEELVSVFGQGSAEQIMVRADRNGDGELSRLEIRVRNDDDEDDEEGGDESDESDAEENSSDEGDESDDEEDESDESDEGDESDGGDESDDAEDAED